MRVVRPAGMRHAGRGRHEQAVQGAHNVISWQISCLHQLFSLRVVAASNIMQNDWAVNRQSWMT